MKKGLLLFIIVLLMGSAFLAAGIYEFSNRLNLSENGLEAEGTVVDLKKHHDKKKVFYMPEIEFTLKSSQGIRFVDSSCSNPPAYSIGQKVNIIYSKDNPKNAVIKSKLGMFGLPVSFILFGALLVLIDLRILIRRIKAILSPFA
jgi:hypothetical protein